jgi:hypothetical protein
VMNVEAATDWNLHFEFVQYVLEMVVSNLVAV